MGTAIIPAGSALAACRRGGSCTDYPPIRLNDKSKRQRGNAGTWQVNSNLRWSPRPLDVVVFRSPSPWGHVAVVERVNANATFQVSEWNYGNEWVGNRNCAETNLYGRTDPRGWRTVRLNDPTIKGFWR